MVHFLSFSEYFLIHVKKYILRTKENETLWILAFRATVGMVRISNGLLRSNLAIMIRFLSVHRNEFCWRLKTEKKMKICFLKSSFLYLTAFLCSIYINSYNSFQFFWSCQKKKKINNYNENLISKIYKKLIKIEYHLSCSKKWTYK